MGTKISALTAASAATGSEAFPVVQSAATRKMTLNQALVYIQAQLESVFASSAQGTKADNAVPAAAVPATAASTGIAGQVAYDANYIYVCIATDTWKRAALTTW